MQMFMTILVASLSASNPFGVEVGDCEKADQYQAAYLESGRVLDLGYYTHYTGLCLAGVSTVNLNHCRTAQSYQDQYMRTGSVVALNNYTTYTSKCLYDN